jgi:hypothetical protein
MALQCRRVYFDCSWPDFCVDDMVKWAILTDNSTMSLVLPILPLSSTFFCFANDSSIHPLPSASMRTTHTNITSTGQHLNTIGQAHRISDIPAACGTLRLCVAGNVDNVADLSDVVASSQRLLPHLTGLRRGPSRPVVLQRIHKG